MAMREIPEAASRHHPSDNRGDGGGAMDVRGQLSWQIRRIHSGGEAARWARSGCLRAEPAGESQQAISNPRLPLPSRYLHPHIVECVLSHTHDRLARSTLPSITRAESLMSASCMVECARDSRVSFPRWWRQGHGLGHGRQQPRRRSDSRLAHSSPLLSREPSPHMIAFESRSPRPTVWQPALLAWWRPPAVCCGLRPCSGTRRGAWPRCSSSARQVIIIRGQRQQQH